MMNLPWWVIVIAIAVVFLIYRILKGLNIVRSCRKEFLKEGKITEPKTTEEKFDEKFDAGKTD